MNDRQSRDLPNQPPDQPLRLVEIDIDVPPPLTRIWNSVFHGWANNYWPLYGQFENSMRRRVYNLIANKQAKQEKSIEFQGSLQSGIDFRRTLRSYLTYQPKLYIKTVRKATSKLLDRNEPILWLFQTNVMNAGLLSHTYFGYQDANKGFAHSWFLADEETVVFNGTNSKNEPVRIYRQKLLGIVYFVDASTTVDDLKTQFGSSFHQRVPSLRDVEYMNDIGEILYPKNLVYPKNISWWEYLLIGSIHYAKETLLIVSPTNFTIPYHIFKYAHDKGKDIMQLPLSQFATDEVRRLQMRYFIETKLSRTKEATHPDELTYLVENFSDVMKQFW